MTRALFGDEIADGLVFHREPFEARDADVGFAESPGLPLAQFHFSMLPEKLPNSRGLSKEVKRRDLLQSTAFATGSGCIGDWARRNYLVMPLPKLPLHWNFQPQSKHDFMDKIVSIFTWPVGLILCFGPVLFIWLKAEIKESRSDNPIDKQK